MQHQARLAANGAAALTVIEMLCHAMEIGYVTALDDIRRGALDQEIQRSRPGLTSGQRTKVCGSPMRC
jgi:hypothetical protein